MAQFWSDFQRRFLHTITHRGSPLRLVHGPELEKAHATARAYRNDANAHNKGGAKPALPAEGPIAAQVKTPTPTIADDPFVCFSHAGKPLPCLLEADNDPTDPWLVAPSYYPLYARLFAAKATSLQSGNGQVETLRDPHAEPAFLRMLEIGVRTGYMGVVLARATQGRAHYTGIDPNLYLPDGLARANASFSLLQKELPSFGHQLILGYSTAEIYQDAMALNGPYDIIHIDGDHSLHGKVTDLFIARKLLAPGGWLLVDDYGHAPSVAPACRAALAEGWYRTLEYIPTYRGCGLLTV
jgi:hypothetical protein